MNKGKFFEEACRILELSEEEKRLAEELLEGPAALDKIKNRGGGNLSPVFAHMQDRVCLYPVFMAYVNGELPAAESGELPPGMELLFPRQEKLYGEREVVEDLQSLFEDRNQDRPLCCVVLENEEGSSRFAAEQAACRLGMPLLLWDGEETAWPELLLTALLYDALVCLDLRKGDGGKETAVRLAERIDRFLVLAADREAVGGLQRRVSCLFRRVPHTAREDREACLRDYTETEGLELPDRIRARLTDGGYGMDTLKKILWEFSAEAAWSSQGRLTESAAARILADYPEGTVSLFGITRLSSDRRLSELCLPREQYRKLSVICSMLGKREQVLEKWGFAHKYSYGNGISLLFYGAPGTGKTMAAQAVAGELGMPLYRADLSQLISKYIGETQKNIGRIFQQAGHLKGILLFDEADALFARRNEVGDAQDKYSNAETAYLLQRMEEWDGICILATNLLQNFDEAFRRRITYMLNFPMPDAGQREKLWEKVFPRDAELSEDMDASILAGSFELSGAAIKNAALQGAYLAAVEEGPIGMKHVLSGIANEYGKLNKTMKPEQKALLEKYEGLS